MHMAVLSYKCFFFFKELADPVICNYISTIYQPQQSNIFLNKLADFPGVILSRFDKMYFIY